MILRAFATALFAALGIAAALSAEAKVAEPKVVLVTFDGVRWRDVFRGADQALVDLPQFVHPDIKTELIDPAYVRPADRAAALMPFLHGIIATQGVVYGNRDKGECAKVANDLWFSYPGYNEFLTGHPDPAITSNDKVANPNVSVLEYLATAPGFAGHVGMVGTWDVFPYILNTARSHVPVNAALNGGYPTDVKTDREGLRLLAQHQRLTYIAFGDTDEFAHAGDYAHYLTALEHGDDFLRRLWEYLQSDPYYRGQTTLFVLTDHGRGETPLAAWREHGSPRSYQLTPADAPEYNATGAIGSDAIWFAAIGPAIVRSAVPPPALSPSPHAVCLLQAQTAASLLTALGRDWHDFHPVPGQPQITPAPPLPFVIMP